MSSISYWWNPSLHLSWSNFCSLWCFTVDKYGIFSSNFRNIHPSPRIFTFIFICHNIKVVFTTFLFGLDCLIEGYEKYKLFNNEIVLEIRFFGSNIYSNLPYVTLSTFNDCFVRERWFTQDSNCSKFLKIDSIQLKWHFVA